jgi:hypothetical protein
LSVPALWPPRLLLIALRPCLRYDMLAQRERAINAYFSHVPGRSLSSSAVCCSTACPLEY